MVATGLPRHRGRGRYPSLPRHPPPRPPVTKEVVRELWGAEDGHCEACGSAMDRRFARVDSRRREFAAISLCSARTARTGRPPLR